MIDDVLAQANAVQGPNLAFELDPDGGARPGFPQKPLPDCTCVPDGVFCDLATCGCPLHYLTAAEYQMARLAAEYQMARLKESA